MSSRFEDGEIWYTPEEWEARERIRERSKRRIETGADPPAGEQEQPAPQPKHQKEEPKLWDRT